MIIDDEPVVRHGLAALLTTQDDFDVAGEAHDGPSAVRLVTETAPDIVFVDVEMPGFSDPDAMRQLSIAGGSTCRVILFVSRLDEARVVEMLKLGARAVVMKDTPVALIYKSIRRVHAGEMWIGRGMMEAVFKALVSAPAAPAPAADTPRAFGLTPRERTILKHVVEGDTNKGVAERLALSQDTVKHHLTSIFNKTGVSNRLELALFALHHRLVPPS